jgi:lipopolysaccharide transport protein LptA
VRPELRLSADHLSYQPTASRIDLGGRVVIELGQLQLRAPRLQIVLGAQGRPERLTATGGVTFSAGETSGRADQVLLLTQQRMALLQGKASVRLQRVGLDLHGEAVQLDLASGKLSVRSASASLRSRQSDGP